MDEPLVSIIIPTFNRAHLIGETLDSVAAQTYQNWECIIVDDGSSDRSQEIVQEYVDGDARFRLVPRPDDKPKGASSCRNHGMEAALGKYVIFLDSDDVLLPTCLEGRVRYAEEHPDLDFVAFRSEAFAEVPGDTAGGVVRPSDDSDLDRFLNLVHGWQTLGPIWKKAKLKEIGGWDPSLLSWQDWELNLRAICRGLSYERVDICDSYFRRSDSVARVNSSQRHDLKHLNAAIPLFRKVSDELIKSDKLTVSRSRALTGLAFIVSMRLLWDFGLRASLWSWRQAFRNELIKASDFTLGSFVLSSLAPVPLRRITWPTVLMMFRRRIGWTRKRIIL